LRVPLSWLRDYVDFDLSTDELVELISLRSQEVDGVYRLGVLDGEVVVGEVLEFGPHPNADRLNVAKVDLAGREVQIVAGAPNPYPGAKVPVVLPGSTMADGTKLKEAKLRGLESYGMMMSERELGISGDHGGILLLEDEYEVGSPVAGYFPVGETVLDIDVMPNRPDLWGVIGVARELAAILETDFRTPEPFYETGGDPTARYGLRVEAGDLCPRYDLRRVSGLEAGARAPIWMRRRINAAGMRPVNAIVDATNYVMLETGQPIHAFDAERVRQGIVVRRAKSGEKMTLLDGRERTLDQEMLVIADEERGLVVAGVMGAETAEVGDGTDDVLVEVATFDGRNILETSKRLGLRTDASGRFERGLDPEMVGFAMERVVGLLSAFGGRVAPDILSHYPEPARPREVSLRVERAGLLLGMPVGGDEAARKLELLGCQVQRQDGKLAAAVPTFRRDLEREADLIEEVGRLVGLEWVPEELPGVAQAGGLTTAQRKLRLLRRLLADLGLAEAMTYPFGPDRWRESIGETGGGLRLENPLSAEAANLRNSLLPGLLDAAARNRAFGERGGAIFEVGRGFEADPLHPDAREQAVRFRMTGESDNGSSDARSQLMGVRETPRVGAVLAGAVRPGGWNAPELHAGFFEAKGIVERLVPEAVFEPGRAGFLHPGRSARVITHGEEVGWVGELHPETAAAFDLEGWPVAACELDLSACEPDPETRFRLYFNVPAVNRDLAVVVDAEVPVGDLLSAVKEAAGPDLREARVFDVYEGPQVDEGSKSVAVSLTFRAEETLTDEAVDEQTARISGLLARRFGARVRGS
jgi:phenylalanyl-tRNA synthetase beta chain